MIKIFKYLGKKGWVLFIISVLFIIVEVYLQLEIPTYMQNITKLLQSERSSLSEIWENGWMMLGYAGLTFLAAVITTFFSSYVGSILSRNLRSKVFDSVQSFSMEEMNKFSTPSLITRTTNDVMQVQMFFGMGLNSLIKAPTMIILAYLKMRSKAWQFSVATIVTLLFILISIAIIFILVVPKFKLMQEKIDNINKYSRENLNGLKVVRAFNAEEFQTARFENANKELTDINLYTNRVMSFMNPAIQSAMNFLSIAIYIIGAWLIYNIGPGVDEAIMLQKGLVFSESVVFLNYSMQIIASIMMLVFILIMFPRASVAANRILEVANTKSSIFDGVGDFTETSTGTISFKNVSFKYPDAEGKVLDNISFDVNPGETVAFIGSTGSGKSTLINLVPRFYDVTDGEILVDGINVKDYKVDELHKKFGYVSQTSVIFKGTVESNIAFGEGNDEEFSEDDVKKAARIAQGSSFIEELEDGYQAAISQRGTNLSGGQKQRISIARAIARNPEIFIFDDSFSALDYRTDRELRKALKEELNEKTALIVAQRIGTILDADKIIVLDKGRLVQIGKHKELLENCQIYQEIAYSQLSPEELNHE